MGRSRSGSSSSSSSSGSDRGHKVKKEKKDKKNKGDKHKDDKDKKHKQEEIKIPGIGKLPGPAGQLLGAFLGGSGMREAEQHKNSGHGEYSHQQVPMHGQPPLMPMYTQHQPQYGHGGGHSGGLDPSRLPPYARALNTHNPLPPPNEVGYAACSDVDGSPLFLVLVPHKGGLHPGKMAIRSGAHQPEIYVSWGGSEVGHSGDYALVPFDPQRMHWVYAPRAELPHGARPIDAGHEEDGTPLYFALGRVNGGRVPGKAGRHLGGASVPFAGAELLDDHAEILCWI